MTDAVEKDQTTGLRSTVAQERQAYEHGEDPPHGSFVGLSKWKVFPPITAAVHAASTMLQCGFTSTFDHVWTGLRLSPQRPDK